MTVGELINHVFGNDSVAFGYSLFYSKQPPDQSRGYNGISKPLHQIQCLFQGIAKYEDLSQPRTQFPLDYADKDTVTELTNQVFYTFESLNKEFIASMHSVGIILNFLISNV